MSEKRPPHHIRSISCQVIDKMKQMDDMKGRTVNECCIAVAGCIQRETKQLLGISKGNETINREVWW